MKIYTGKDYDEMSKKAANIIAAQITLKPDCVLGLATGSSPIGTYQQLIQKYQNGDLDFSGIRTINLDEYKGLSQDNSQSYFYFMNENLFKHVNISLDNTNIPNGLATDSLAECARYEQIIEGFGGADLQLLGIGHNGHIGFNEPTDSFEKYTHEVALSERTIEANSRLFASKEEVPTHAFTMGIKSIMQAKKILLIASGSDKAQIIKDAFTGPITPNVPASILQLHPDVTLVGDKAALSLISQI